jgi:hypothetical protein
VIVICFALSQLVLSLNNRLHSEAGHPEAEVDDRGFHIGTQDCTADQQSRTQKPLETALKIASKNQKMLVALAGGADVYSGGSPLPDSPTWGEEVVEMRWGAWVKGPYE